MRAWHVLVVEGEHVAAGREIAQAGQRAVVAQPGPGHDLGRALAGVGGQDAEADAQAGGGLAGHPGELAAADHAHHGGCWSRGRRLRGIGHAPYPTGPAAVHVARM